MPRPGLLLLLLLVACNDAHIDPRDAAVREVDAAPDLAEPPDASSDTDAPDLPWEVSALETSPTGLTATVCWRGPAALDPATISARFGTTPVTPTIEGACLSLAATLPPGKHSLRVEASDTSGAVVVPLWLPLWVEAEPFDWRRALLYMIMVDRFRDSDGRADPTPDVPTLSNFQGGDLGGVVAALEEGWFSQLGVDALWLTPVLDNASGAFIGIDGVHVYSAYHGYWPVSADAIDPRFAPDGVAPDDAFAALVAAAHARGVRVLIDVVLNHVHEQHAYCQERPAMCRRTCVCGTSGCDWQARALDCQFASYLPDLDHADPETRGRVVADLLAFVRRYDLDGLRLDAVKHVDPAVIRAIRAPLDALNEMGGAPLWLVGETFAGDHERALVASFLSDDLLDGQFDFPLFWTIRDTFVGNGSFRDLESAVVASAAAYGEHTALMSPFAGNHDVERLSTVLAGNDLGPWGGTVDVLAENRGETPQRWDIINPFSMAMAFVLTLPGVPLVYMGDELGLGGSNDPDNRRMLPAEPSTDQAEILRRVRELGRARRDNPVLALGERRELWLDDDFYVQARWRPDADPVDTVIIAMNKGEAKTIEVALPPELGAAGRRFTSLLSERSVTADADRLTLSLAPWEYLLLRAE